MKRGAIRWTLLLLTAALLSFGTEAHMHVDVDPQSELQYAPEVWMQALGATLLISAAPVVLLFFVPVHNATQNRPLLKILLAFAMGGLLGDVFLHLLPHSFAPHDHAHDHHDHVHHDHSHDHHDHAHDHHDHAHDHSHDHHDHAHDHTHDHAHDHDHDHDHDHEHDALKELIHSQDDHHHDHDEHDHMAGTMIGLWIIVGIFVFLLVEKTIRNLTGGHGHSHSQNTEHKGKKGKKGKKAAAVEHAHVSKVSGFLNLAADFTHNLTDGLAIGATFSAGGRMGMITTVAILLHEVPHEIGDFAILVHSGFTKWQAMKLQLVTAIGALLGTAIGLATGGMASAANIILPITAGGFIYISTVSVIPELLEDSSSFKQTFLELFAACIGVSFMFVIALLE